VGIEAGIDTILVEGSVGAGTAAAGGISAGAAAGIAGGAAAGIGAGAALADGGSAATGAAPVPVNSATNATGPSTSANPGGSAAPKASGFFGNAVKASLAGSVASFGLNKVFGPGSGRVNIPPPPGAAMIDPEGAQAAAQMRARQAAAGGLNSTVTGAGVGPAATASFSATSGGKQLLGE
jgi:hypothetical protein